MLTCVLLSGGKAVGQYRNNYYQYPPNYGSGSMRAPYGSYNQQRQNVGKTQFDPFKGPGGSPRCTPQYIGYQIVQNCN